MLQQRTAWMEELHIGCCKNMLTFNKTKFLTLPECIIASPVALPLQ